MKKREILKTTMKNINKQYSHAEYSHKKSQVEGDS